MFYNLKTLAEDAEIWKPTPNMAECVGQEFTE